MQFRCAPDGVRMRSRCGPGAVKLWSDVCLMLNAPGCQILSAICTFPGDGVAEVQKVRHPVILDARKFLRNHVLAETFCQNAYFVFDR